MTDKIQTVRLTLADGTKATFTGPVQVQEVSQITDAEFWVSDMPEGCKWGTPND